MVAGLGGGTTAPKIGLLRREGAPIPVWGRGEEWQQQNREGVWGLEDMCNGAQLGAGAEPRRAERSGWKGMTVRGGSRNRGPSFCFCLDLSLP